MILAPVNLCIVGLSRCEGWLVRAYYYFVPGMCAVYCAVIKYVCLPISITKTTKAKLYHIFGVCCLRLWLSPPLAVLWCVMCLWFWRWHVCISKTRRKYVLQLTHSFNTATYLANTQSYSPWGSTGAKSDLSLPRLLLVASYCTLIIPVRTIKYEQ